MTLLEFINKYYPSQKAFAEKMRTSPKNISMYAKGRVPAVPKLIDIYIATQGQVTPNDMIPLPKLTPPPTDAKLTQ